MKTNVYLLAIIYQLIRLTNTQKKRIELSLQIAD